MAQRDAIFKTSVSADDAMAASMLRYVALDLLSIALAIAAIVLAWNA